MNIFKLYPFPGVAPERFTYPFCYTPHPWTLAAAQEVREQVHAYMAAHPESELHRCGKMFGVLVCRQNDGQTGYLCAFSAMLDGIYHHPGFVPPVVDISRPDGYFKQEEARISAINRRIEAAAEEPAAARAALQTERKQRSQALQRWMFAEYRMLNAQGETRDLPDIFSKETPILTEEEWFERRAMPCSKGSESSERAMPCSKGSNGTIPPSGAGECCLPKMLQYAYQQGLTPLCMGEFWIGASPKNEIRTDGVFYPSCQGKCRPILGHMLQGLRVEDNPLRVDGRRFAAEVKVLFEDPWILAVSKPAGMLSVPGKDGIYALTDWAIGYLKGPAFPVHRLDQDTSGILLLAKTQEAQSALQKIFLRRDIHKRYEAVLAHAPREDRPDEGNISLPLLPDPFDRPRQTVNTAHGKPAVTRYALQERRADGTCLLFLYPETGRTHQLRVHCAHPDGLNAPILGDRLYGGTLSPYAGMEDINNVRRDTGEGLRLMLHAAEIRFPHPFTGENITLVCPSGF